MRTFVPLTFLFASFAAALVADESVTPKPAIELPGRRADGAVLLPNQWSLNPVGEQLAVGDFPVNIQLSPDGRFAAVLHCGYKKHEVVVLDVKTRKIVSRTPVNEAFYGLAFSRDGKRLFCSGSGDEVLHSFAFADGQLSDEQAIALRDVKKRGVPGGIAIASDGTIYVANVWGHSVTRVRGGEATDLSMVKASATLATAPVEKKAPEAAEPSPAEPDADRATRKRFESELDLHSADEPFPYACVLDEKRARLYVSLWAHAQRRGDRHEGVQDHRTLARRGAPERDAAHQDGHAPLRREREPQQRVGDRHLVGHRQGDAGRHPAARRRRRPQSKTRRRAISRTRSRSRRTASGSSSRMRTSTRSPSSTSKTPGKAREPRLHPRRLVSDQRARHARRQNAAGRQRQRRHLEAESARARTLASRRRWNTSADFSKARSASSRCRYADSARRRACGQSRGQDCPRYLRNSRQNARVTSRLRLRALDREANGASNLEGSPIPRKVGDPSPIKYCIYIVKENRTYDQVLGDLAQGNGDPSLCLFREEVTPNHHALAREFVLLDNFYVESEVSADGHEWTMGA